MGERTIRLDVDLELTLGAFTHGPRDPAMRVGRAEAWRATRTPEGAATARFCEDGDRVHVRAWGPGAQWALEAAPDLLGARDDPAAFRPHHPILRDMHRRTAGMRLGRTGSVLEALVPTILEQKVTTIEAWRAWFGLVRRYGEPAPGPAPGGSPLRLPPAPDVLAALPYWAFHPFGVERKRADTVRRACARAPRLEEAAAMRFSDARRRLTAIQGVGEWTAAEVARSALGDPDAVSVGDYHLPHQVAWVLAGEPRADDARMLELLEPYRGQRARAIRLIELSGLGPPRRGPHMPLRSIARI